MSYDDIDIAELDALLQRKDLYVIDIRDAAARSRGSLPGARAPSDELIGELMQKRRSQPPVLVYCYHGNSSRDFCGFLIQLGLKQVYNLNGGWAAWEHRQQSGLKDWMQAQGFDGNDIDTCIERGMSALMQAALQGERKHVEELLASGADVNRLNDDHHHALWFACVHGDPRLVETLIKHGARIDQRNVNGVTCAIYAASAGRLEALKVLVEAGADLSVKTPEGFDALDSAATLPVLRYLKPLMYQAG